MRTRRIAVFLASFVLLVPAWSGRKQIRVDHQKVTAPLADFPVLVTTTDSDLRTIVNGGQVAGADGSDIVFTAADGTTRLAHELVHYNGATGEVAAWIKVPVLSAATDTVLYAYFGNPNAAADPARRRSSTAVIMACFI